MKIKISILILLTTASLNAQTLLFVSMDGDDQNIGSLESPFKSLGRAREAVRRVILDGKEGDIVVNIRKGNYQLDETFVLNHKDSPSNVTVTWTAYSGESVNISGGKSIQGWKRLKNPPKDLPAVARGKVWVVDVPEGGKFYVLFDGEKILSRACSEKYSTDDRVAENPNQELCYRSGDIANWPDLAEAEIFITPNKA